MRFLEDARDRNVLRTVGPVCRFRHAPDLPLFIRLLNFAPHSPNDRAGRGLGKARAQIAATQSDGPGDRSAWHSQGPPA